jgi:hypothetical protein
MLITLLWMEIVLNQNKQIIISKLGIKMIHDISNTWYFLDTKCAKAFCPK